MDPARRTLLKVTMEDAFEASTLFETLMGRRGGAAAEVHRGKREVGGTSTSRASVSSSSTPSFVTDGRSAAAAFR